MHRHEDGTRTRPLAAVTLLLCGAGCLASPPEGPLVEGPTLTIELPSLSQANVVGSEMVATGPLGDAAKGAHADFIAANAAILGPQKLVALWSVQVRLRPGSGVDDLADAFGALMLYVAPESNPAARVYLASALAPASAGPAELAMIGKRADYEGLQTLFKSSSFIVGVSGPTSVLPDQAIEFGLGIEVKMAIMDVARRQGGH